MKAVLVSLLSFILIQSQAFALRLQYPVTLSVNGAYAGVLLPDPTDPLTDPNAIGLFTASIPSTGLSTGAFLVFANGSTFNGTMSAFVDLDKSTIQGILQANYTFNITTFDIFGVATTTAVTASALGPINATFVSSTNPLTSGLSRLTGTAVMNIDYGQTDVNGARLSSRC